MSQEKKRTPNCLINEKSPYLLQHAYNLVNWYPWSEEAFERAQNEDKPIFLSIGYSTCHWCHVMERESFEDEEVASVLNKNFISIKVDKEERPDIDTIYMSICTAINGHGGWPMSIFMTPDQKPFFVNTYFPKRTRGQMIGFLDLCERITQLWKGDRQRLLTSSDDVIEAVKEQTEANTIGVPNAQTLGSAFLTFKRMFDEKYGGFGLAPKFPTPHNLMFLLRYAVQFENSTALEMVHKTLIGMYKGGIYDHIGGGFSRYSTDEFWLAPHFEKMLYDNALLVIAYAEAYQQTKNTIYKTIVYEVLSYLNRELAHEGGGFYCAQDADSEGEEGKYYVFDPEEIKQILGEGVAEQFNQQYDIKKHGNFEGKSIPNLIQSDNLDIIDKQQLQQSKQKLYDYRRTRCKLHRDDKILTSWNALAIVAYAKAYQVFQKEEYLETAIKTADFIETNLKEDDSRLFIRYRAGEKFGKGCIDEYAYYAYAMLEMYEACYEAKYLKESMKLLYYMLKHFWDKEKSGFYFYADDSEQLILRPKETFDGATPSGNAVACYVLFRLYRLMSEPKYQEYAESLLGLLATETEDYPTGHAFALLAYLEKFRCGKELVCVVKNKETAKEIKEVLSHVFVPNLITIFITADNRNEVIELIPHLKDYKESKNGMTFYYCEGNACQEPFSDIHRLEELLNKVVK